MEEYRKVAQRIYAQLDRELSRWSDYARVLFHPQNFAKFLPHLHRRINGCFQSYSLQTNEVQWDRLYPFLLDYARTADPNHKKLTRPIVTLQDAHTDLLRHLEDYFVHLSIGSEHRYRNYLREQAGTWAYKASMAIAPKYPMERPLDEATIGGKLIGNEERDSGLEEYYFSKNPHANAMVRALDTEKLMNQMTPF